MKKELFALILLIGVAVAGINRIPEPDIGKTELSIVNHEIESADVIGVLSVNPIEHFSPVESAHFIAPVPAPEAVLPGENGPEVDITDGPERTQAVNKFQSQFCKDTPVNTNCATGYRC